MVFADNASSLGGTPLVRLNSVTRGVGATVLAKVEGRNPAFSVKDRVGVAMIRDAEERGLLHPGRVIVEATSGNTGIGLAFAAAARGIGCILAMPETMSLERRKVLLAFGARLMLTPGPQGMSGALERVEKMVAEDPERYLLMRQFENPANPAIHRQTTGPEIWQATEGRVDVLVAGVGTGGTLTGIARHFAEDRGQELHVVAVEPASSPVLTQFRAGQPLQPGPHKIQGLGAGFIPHNLDMELVDQVEAITDEEALDLTRRLAREEGLLCGVSSGAAVAAALRVAREPRWEGRTVVCVLPDAGERYLSGPLFEGLDENLEEIAL
ncbi:MAG: cysteine synthase A [Candidatus Xenobium sp.]|jgi:cysteine synthase A|nr:cysteine synthase A [Burkholderiales bacterium]